jgi:hypothetical protein
MLNVTSNTWFTVNLSQPRSRLASTSSTNKIFFGGGYSKIVDIFEIPFPLHSSTWSNDTSKTCILSHLFENFILELLLLVVSLHSNLVTNL